MPPTTGTNEEIIEKRDSSPLATSCMVLAALALLGAMALQISEIADETRTLSDSEIQTLLSSDFDRALKRQIDAIEKETQDLVATYAIPDDLIDRVAATEKEAPGAPGTLWKAIGGESVDAPSGGGGDALSPDDDTILPGDDDDDDLPVGDDDDDGF